MSMIKTALVTALLTSSTAAMAAPGVSVSANANVTFAASTSPAVRDHRNDAPYSMPKTTTSWSMLSASLQLKNGTDVIRLQGRQTLSQIRLQATSGRLQIDRVTVRFQDGTSQTIRTRKQLSADSSMMQLDLQANRSGVESISISGYGGRRASYQVFALDTRLGPSFPSRPVVSFTGTYTSKYGDVVLEQIGNRIHGEYPTWHGTIEGYVSNGVAVINWSQPEGSGRATFAIAANGKLEGTLGNGTSMTNVGEWDLFRKR
jgi:hypothetical protein